MAMQLCSQDYNAFWPLFGMFRDVYTEAPALKKAIHPETQQLHALMSELCSLAHQLAAIVISQHKPGLLFDNISLTHVMRSECKATVIISCLRPLQLWWWGVP
eukprot:TRINITY_DN325_c0_g1_i11.p2 TRINITY_DN325_c0_g1~~TRINITY_DN325_c0_g1_i11.p2  ORF type:complete len:103 (+),score=3.30 TRINITY_DN325_c0_g1_i11:2725-3033(+)